MKAELMRYRNDSLSFYMVIVGLIFEALYLMILYSTKELLSDAQSGLPIGIDILFNIIFLLAAFLTSEKVKTYTLGWCYVSLGLGILQIPRIALPIFLKNIGQIATGRFVTTLVLLLVSAVFFFAGFATSLIKSRKLDAYLKQINERA